MNFVYFLFLLFSAFHLFRTFFPLYLTDTFVYPTFFNERYLFNCIDSWKFFHQHINLFFHVLLMIFNHFLAIFFYLFHLIFHFLTLLCHNFMEAQNIISQVLYPIIVVIKRIKLFLFDYLVLYDQLLLELYVFNH